MRGLQRAGQASTLPSIDKYLPLPKPRFKGCSVPSGHTLCLTTLPVFPHLAWPSATPNIDLYRLYSGLCLFWLSPPVLVCFSGRHTATKEGGQRGIEVVKDGQWEEDVAPHNKESYCCALELWHALSQQGLDSHCSSPGRAPADTLLFSIASSVDVLNFYYLS